MINSGEGWESCDYCVGGGAGGLKKERGCFGAECKSGERQHQLKGSRWLTTREMTERQRIW